MHWFTLVFGQERHISIGQECARAVLIFAYALLLVRLAGRRVFGKWSALDIVVSILVGSTLSRALTGSAPLFGTLAATTLLLVLHRILAWGSASSEMLSALLEGMPVRLGSGGELRHDRRIAHTVSHADLGEALRQSGLSSVSQTREVTLEPSGRITVLKVDQHGPAAAIKGAIS